ncbi:(2Fe-2S)-binding protein [bacterium]|nr:(2Fe-2S)-binding protein [bacterium]
MKLNVAINGEAKEFDIHPKDMLLDVLRDDGYTGVKRGCSTGDCGACAIILDGKAVNSCILFAAQAEGGKITTVEGIGNPKVPSPVQREMTDAGGIQCGFCVPGIVVSATALIDENPEPTEDEIREALDGNLCRCTGYVKQIEAITLAVKETRKTRGARLGVA